MSKQHETSKEQAQMQTPPTQGNLEERNKKRGRELATPASGPSVQPGAKRQRLNPLSEEEFFEDTTNSQRKEGKYSHKTFPIGGTSISSQRKDLERQQSTEVSSFRPPGNDTSDIKKTFMEIKARNDPLRI